MPSPLTPTTQRDLRPKKDDRPYFEAEDGTRHDVLCDVVDDLLNMSQDGNYERLDEGLEVIRAMALRMENKLREYRKSNGEES
jgi:hypothetical protein